MQTEEILCKTQIEHQFNIFGDFEILGFSNFRYIQIWEKYNLPRNNSDWVKRDVMAESGGKDKVRREIEWRNWRSGGGKESEN